MTPGSAPDIEAKHRAAVQALNARDYRRTHSLCLDILSSRPDCADAFFLLAMIAAAHGNHAKAAELIERAMRLDPTVAQYPAYLGRSLLALQRPREAFEAACAALALNPPDALTLDTIGVVMTRTGAHAEALEPFQRATRRDSRKAQFFYNLGASLQFVGRFEEAAAACRRAIELAPSFYRAWSSLAQVRRAPFSEQDVARLEDMLAQGLDEDGELHVCHALAKQMEDTGRHADAFRYLSRGKGRKRRGLHYDFARDRALFLAAKVEGRKDQSGHDSREPIFIVGMPRTGTTLVERILSSHPAVFAAGELSHFSLAVKRGTGTESNRVLDEETLLAANDIDLAVTGRAYVESTRPRTGHTPHFIDKMPLNFFYAGIIHRALPNAKIICLRRNPLDTALSNYRQLFATSFSYYNYTYDLLDTGRYYVEFARLAEYWRATLPANYCEVHYERVVADTEGEARRLLEFCGLEWDPACLNFSENAAPVATASSVQVRQPIYTTAVERWRKYADQIQPLIELFRREGILEP